MPAHLVLQSSPEASAEYAALALLVPHPEEADQRDYQKTALSSLAQTETSAPQELSKKVRVRVAAEQAWVLVEALETLELSVEALHNDVLVELRSTHQDSVAQIEARVVVVMYTP